MCLTHPSQWMWSTSATGWYEPNGRYEPTRRSVGVVMNTEALDASGAWAMYVMPLETVTISGIVRVILECVMFKMENKESFGCRVT